MERVVGDTIDGRRMRWSTAKVRMAKRKRNRVVVKRDLFADGMDGNRCGEQLNLGSEKTSRATICHGRVAGHLEVGDARLQLDLLIEAPSSSTAQRASAADAPRIQAAAAPRRTCGGRGSLS